jgi:hypothetical protein
MDANGNGWLSDAVRCYDYCTNADAQVISNSWGVYESSAALQVCACVGMLGWDEDPQQRVGRSLTAHL